MEGVDTWDVQWILTTWRYRALSVRPNQNLVRNIGFRPDATHTYGQHPVAQRVLQATAVWSPDGSRPVARNRSFDQWDESVWALMNWRSVILMALPKWWVKARLRIGK